MNYNKFLYFKTIADLGSISKASEFLFVSQSSLSQYLKKLEQEFGLELFYRTKDGMVLTYAGKRVYETVKEILNSLNELNTDISYINNLEKGNLVFGVPSFLGSFIIPQIVKKYEELYPKIKLQIVEADTKSLESMLLKQKIRVAIMYSLNEHNQIVFDELKKTKFVLITSKNYIDKNLSKIQLKKEISRILSEEEFILSSEKRRTREVINNIFKFIEVKPKIKLEVSNFITIFALVKSGYANSIIPEDYLNFYSDREELDYYYLDDIKNSYCYLSIAKNPNFSLSKSEKELISIVREILK